MSSYWNEIFNSTAVFDAKILVRSLYGRTKNKFSHKKSTFSPHFGAANIIPALRFAKSAVL